VDEDKKKMWKEIMRSIARFPPRGAKGADRPEEIRFEVTDKRPDGDIEITVHIPNEEMKVIKDIVDGKRLSRFVPARPKVDALARARMGEYEPLIRRLEEGGELTDKERQALAKIARGTLPRIGRPPESETETRNRNIARFALVLRRWGGRRVTDVTARKFNIDRSYVPKLLKKYPHEAGADYLIGIFLRSMGADMATVRKVVLGSAGITADDMREATGRKKRTK
jgi:hypothetical protein